MEKESEKSVNDSGKKDLEIKDNTTHIVEKDANKKDSTYWAKISPIPLSEIEMKSLRTSDSIKSASSLKELKTDTVTKVKNKEKNKFLRTIQEIGLGHTWSDTTGFRFTYGGLIDLKNLSFNTVDGFVYGLDFRISKSWKNKTSLSFCPGYSAGPSAGKS